MIADTERHAQAKRYFAEVCDLVEGEQFARLRELTSDAEIIAFVTLLLKQTQTDHPRVSRPILQAMSAVAGDEVKIGDTLGAWKLVDEIGRGGMGTVFRAARSDGHFEQDAAVKLLHGIPSVKALEYLARERQILATLTHPNIARLYDGGATPNGQPYLVMEHVDGIAIDTHVRDKKPSPHDIIKLMIDVCDAISFAHQRLIVHCDIKPSNILVTATGRPMLLDFGIARLLDGDTRNEPATDAPPSQASSKQTQARAFTPQYASPEQRAGAALTTATDVYSLGKMLGELLDASTHQELAAIIGKATHDDASQRYPTASALAADLDRTLQHQPVKAISATPGYIAKKFTQRNWPWLAAAGVFAISIGIAATRVLAERDRAQTAERQALQERDATQLARAEAERERDRVSAAEQATAKQRDRAAQAEQAAVAERDRAKISEVAAVKARDETSLSLATAKRERSRAERAAKFLGNVLGAVDPNRARDLDKTLMREILDQAAVSAQRELADEPLLLADIERIIGITYGQLVEADKAIPHLNKALSLLPTTSVRERLTLRAKIADLKDAKGLTQDALAEHEAIFAERLGAFGALDADTLQSRHALADQRNRVGLHQRALNDALALQPDIEKVLGSDNALSLDNRHTIAMAHSDLGLFAKAEPDYRRVLQDHTRVYGENHIKVFSVVAGMAIMYLRNDHFAEAEQLLRPQLPRVVKRTGESSYYAIQVSALLASALRKGGKLEESGTYYQFALEQARKRFGPAHGLTLNYEINYANFEVATGKAEAALATYNRIEPIISRERGAQSPTISELLRGRASALTLLARRVEAKSDWEGALAIDRNTFKNEDHPRIKEALEAIKVLESAR